ncbi:hypothetical protein [Vibrio gallicus]|uniref:hypothetical protein n=1 Tax=Vibrio gallicus TaxID=190897 RepID=UPI0021C3F54F|nr:hypothetical protein [Vibrio gallicus]
MINEVLAKQKTEEITALLKANHETTKQFLEIMATPKDAFLFGLFTELVIELPEGHQEVLLERFCQMLIQPESLDEELALCAQKFWIVLEKLFEHDTITCLLMQGTFQKCYQERFISKPEYRFL